jgi:hypothetical protein
MALARESVNDTGRINTPLVNVAGVVTAPVLNASAVGALRPVGDGVGSVAKRREALGVTVWDSITAIFLLILQKTL